jgi:RNA polymerase sigma-70 factor (ECF subfamily)
VVQEVFLRVWTRANGFDASRGEAAGWLFSITRNACTDRLRRGQRDRATFAEPRDDSIDLPSGAPVVPGSDEVAERAWLGGVTRAAVERLAPEQRKIIELCYFEHLTQVEAATYLGIPLGTVKSRTFHALRQLRGVLDRWGVHETA